MIKAIITGDLGKLGKLAEQRIAVIVQNTAEDVVKDAKARVPVDTGRLQSSIGRQRIDEHTQLVTVGAPYGAAVEFGTGRVVARPYLIPAVEAAREPFFRKIAEAYSRD